jgi:hypothetical protein
MTPTATASPKAAKLTKAQSIAEIKKNWVTLFNGAAPYTAKVGIVQNGATFEPILKEQAANSTAKGATATVQSVTLTSATTASVGYTVLLGGSPVLTNQKGTAVLQGGVWKVSVPSFCGIASLEFSGKTIAGCPSAAG